MQVSTTEAVATPTKAKFEGVDAVINFKLLGSPEYGNRVERQLSRAGLPYTSPRSSARAWSPLHLYYEGED